MNVRFTIFPLLACQLVVGGLYAQQNPEAQRPVATQPAGNAAQPAGNAAQPADNAAQPAGSSVPGGAALVRQAHRVTSGHGTIESKLRVRTDLMGQPLVGSGEYAQMTSSAGLFLRMSLSIQAGNQPTSVQQFKVGRDLWEHWRIGETERINHIDLRRVDEAVQRAGGAVGTSANLASGGVPKLLAQLANTFDFDRAAVRPGKLGEVPVWFATGVWIGEKLAKAAPSAVDGDKIVYDRLPAHLPHQVELVLGREDFFPYRVTYLRYRTEDGKHVLRPAVTTEFYGVAIGYEIDPSQFNYKPPANVSFSDRTDAFLKAMGIGSTEVAGRPELPNR